MHSPEFYWLVIWVPFGAFLVLVAILSRHCLCSRSARSKTIYSVNSGHDLP